MFPNNICHHIFSPISFLKVTFFKKNSNLLTFFLNQESIVYILQIVKSQIQIFFIKNLVNVFQSFFFVLQKIYLTKKLEIKKIYHWKEKYLNFDNLNCDKTQNFKLWRNCGTQIVIKLKNSNSERKYLGYGRHWISRLMQIEEPIKILQGKIFLIHYFQTQAPPPSSQKPVLKKMKIKKSSFYLLITCQVSHVMSHLSHVTCHMSLQEQPQQQTLPFVIPTQCTVVGPRIRRRKKFFFEKQKKKKI